MRLHLRAGERLAVLAFAALTVVGFLVLLRAFGGPSLGLSSTRALTVRLGDAQGVGGGADVLVHGVQVGRVTGDRLEGGRVELRFTVPTGLRLYRDASAWIALKTPLGEGFVDLDPGRVAAGRLPAGTRAVAAGTSVRLDEALGVLAAPARRDLQALLGESAVSLSSPAAGGELPTSVTQLDAAVSGLDTLAGTLSGQDRQIGQAITDGTAALGQLGTHEPGVREIVTGGRQTLAALAAERGPLAAALSALPGIVALTHGVLAQARPLVAAASPLVGDLRAAAPSLGAALRRAPTSVRDVQVILRRTPALDDAAAPTLTAARRVLPTVAAASAVLGPDLADLVPILNYLQPRANTIAAWFANTADLGSSGDEQGPWARFFVLFDPSSLLDLPGAPAANAYTAPGDAAHNVAYARGGYSRLEPFRP
ncbi:MAG TPA: MlaD family protein [Solirubrobacteraceae bacterium]|nr:MlaD family protein [Solirubrobacteraceae bacterium]